VSQQLIGDKSSETSGTDALRRDEARIDSIAQWHEVPANGYQVSGGEH